jgi:hypothetical protein
VTFKFKPRYRGVAWTSIGVGGSLAVVATVLGVIAVPLAGGLLGMGLGAAYLASGTWKLRVVADDAGLEVGTADKVRFKLAWSEVVRVIASPSTNTCFVDGGAAERRLLVPGVGAPAPYDIENRAELVKLILAHVPADKVETVESLEQRMR